MKFSSFLVCLVLKTIVIMISSDVGVVSTQKQPQVELDEQPQLAADSIMARIFGMVSEMQTIRVLTPYFVHEFDRKVNALGRIRHLNETDPDLPKSLSGKVCLMTGGSKGIGAEVVKTLLRKDCHVITGSSSKSSKSREEKRLKILEDVANKNTAKFEMWYLDLASFKSVMNFVERFKATGLPLNYFIANAGVMWVPEYKTTEDGMEYHFQVNYLSHALMVWHLVPLLAETGRIQENESRMVLTGSCLHMASSIRFNDLQSKTVYSKYHAYAQAKLATVMMTYRMSRWLNKEKAEWGSYVKVFTLHPGVCATELLDRNRLLQLFPFLKTTPIFRNAKEGAETVIYAAISNELNGKTGQYLEDSAITKSNAESHDEEQQDRMWKITWDLLKDYRNHELDMMASNWV